MKLCLAPVTHNPKSKLVKRVVFGDHTSAFILKPLDWSPDHFVILTLPKNSQEPRYL